MAASTTGLQDNGAGQIPRTGGMLGGLIDVSSFYFGSGTRLFNQNEMAVAGSQPVPTITPLDPILTRAIVRRQPTGAFGVRVDRYLTIASMSKRRSTGPRAISPSRMPH